MRLGMRVKNMPESIQQDTTNTKLEQALYYLKKLDWSIIPVGTDKKPLIEWKKYQKKKPTKEEVTHWFTIYLTANIGIITGKISNLVVVDIDTRHKGDNKAFNRIATVMAKTGGGGWHYYFLYEENIQNQVGIQKGIDIRGEGGYVIAPPSLHQSGKPYEWVMSPGATEILPLPDFVKKWLSKKGSNNNKSNWNPKVLNGVEDGERNESAASVAGKLLARFPIIEWETEGWKLFQGWNRQNKPPLSEDELRDVFNSIKKREAEKHNSKDDRSLANKLLEGILDSKIIFFHDQYKEGYASLTGDGCEVLKLRSKAFRQWIAKFAWDQYEKIPSSEATAGIIQTLEGIARFNGKLFELSVRIALHDNAIWYDLGRSAVRIDSYGWKIIETPPILFRRFPHQLPQVTPISGGDVKAINDFINLQTEEERLLFLVYTISAFIPDFPHPIFVLFGPQGSGKTTPHRLLKSLIDPSVLAELSAPDSEREFAQQASHHWYFYLDNLSSLPKWLSNAIAKACTGAGFSKRELFSDDEDIIYSFKRVMGINGINLVVESADLLDRSILLGLDRIGKNKRRKEKEFWEAFEEVKPSLLGAIFDTASKALKEYPTISLQSHPRMADFASWGSAIAKALGYSMDEFLHAYNNNISQQNEAALEASPVGTTIIAYMSDRDNWEGTASDLLIVLEKQAEELKINIKSRDWPKDPSWLTRRIQLVHSNLTEQGIRVIRDDKSRPRRIFLSKIEENAVVPDDGDGESPNNINTSTVSASSTQNADGKDDSQKRLSQSPSTGATPPTPFSAIKDGYSEEDLEEVGQLEFETGEEYES